MCTPSHHTHPFLSSYNKLPESFCLHSVHKSISKVRLWYWLKKLVFQFIPKVFSGALGTSVTGNFKAIAYKDILYRVYTIQLCASKYVATVWGRATYGCKGQVLTYHGYLLSVTVQKFNKSVIWNWVIWRMQVRGSGCGVQDPAQPSCHCSALKPPCAAWLKWHWKK